jgi:cytochrome c biogenesis factor
LRPILVVGLVASSSYQQMREIQLNTGESLDIGCYQLAFERLSAVDGSTHAKVLAHLKTSISSSVLSTGPAPGSP